MFSFFKIRFTVFRPVLSLRPFVCGCKSNNKFYNVQYSFNKMFSFPNNHECLRRVVRAFRRGRVYSDANVTGKVEISKWKEKKRRIFCLAKRNVLLLQQHAYPASHKNSALRVSFLFLYTYGNK